MALMQLISRIPIPIFSKCSFGPKNCIYGHGVYRDYNGFNVERGPRRYFTSNKFRFKKYNSYNGHIFAQWVLFIVSNVLKFTEKMSLSKVGNKAMGSSMSSSESRMVFVPVPSGPTVIKESLGSMDDTSRVGDITTGSSIGSSDSRDGSRSVAKDCLRGGP